MITLNPVKKGNYSYVPAGHWHWSDTYIMSDGERLVFHPNSQHTWLFNEKKVCIKMADNSEVYASGTQFKMMYTGKLPIPYSDDTGWHYYGFYGVNNARVIGGIYNKAISDTVYIGCTIPERVPSTNIEIIGIQSYGARRNGLSILSASNVLVYNSTFNSCAGESPQAGVDIEPANYLDAMDNLIFHSCTASYNASHQFFVNLDRITKISPPVSIEFINCQSLPAINTTPFELNKSGATGSIIYNGTEYL